MKKKVTLKYNEDDILEILTEYLAKAFNFEEFNARAMIIGTPGNDLRMIAVIGDSNDNSIEDENLDMIDTKIDYNGSHSKTRYINTSKFANMKIDDC